VWLASTLLAYSFFHESHVIAYSSYDSKLIFLPGHIVVGESTDGTMIPPADDGVRRSMFLPVPDL